ncbi:MAG: type I restriction-modification system subunit M N-terminal domain-containing protein [Verrucomicrobia bacterium]|nr:type I restriction-modification system subunit M N-terminal domain-containing protein [Verrucomicrobiota bacterium]
MANNKTSPNGLAELERRLWSAADQLWANSPLRPSEYSAPVLGLIFLRFADNAFTKAETELKGRSTGRRVIGNLDYQAKGVVFLPDEARFSRLMLVEESRDIGKLLNEAMKAIERGSEAMLKEKFPKGKYADVPGLCKIATRKEIETQGWSLNPGRYVGVAAGEEMSDADFKEQLEAQNEELENLNAQARELERTIAKNVAEILET